MLEAFAGNKNYAAAFEADIVMLELWLGDGSENLRIANIPEW
jgi:hypothetical protein